MSDLERTLGVISEIDRITHLHEQYQSGSRVPKLPSSDTLQKDLFSVLQKYSNGGPNQRIAEAAAGIMSGLAATKDQTILPYLGNALLLTEQSQSGKSNEIAFQDTVRYLLAKSDYTPLRTETYKDGSYHFYTTKEGTKVAAISEKGCQLYSVTLKSEFNLDALVEDFRNLKEGMNQNLVDKVWLFQFPPLFLMTGIVGIGIGSGAGILASLCLDPQMNFGELPIVAFTIGGAISGAYGATYLQKKIFEVTYARELKEETLNFPHTSLTKGVDAILDAFPLPAKGVEH